MENSSSMYLKSIPLVLKDHANKLLKVLYDQQQKSQLCDVSLVVENETFLAHKAVLAACSSYFCALFDQRKQSDETGSKVCNVTIIHLSSVSLNAFIPILHFLYTSQLHVFCENVRDVMKTARKLQIPAIVKACERLIAENVVLPSIHEVKSKEPNNTVITQHNPTQSVLYVDLSSEEDEECHLTSSFEPLFKISESKTYGQTLPVSTYAGLKSRMGRTQKKKGFPKKIEQHALSNSTVVTSSSFRNISTVSPASIFGRVGTGQIHRSRNQLLPNLPSSAESNTKALPTTPVTLDPLPFESNLDSLGSIFGNDSTFIIDNTNTESSVSCTSTLERPPSLEGTSTSTQDLLQLQSVFSMSPNVSTSKSVQNMTNWPRYCDTESRTGNSISISSATISNQPNNVVTIPSFSMQSSGIDTPSIYTCKECFKYFTNLSDAFHHFYSEHQSFSVTYSTSSAASTLTTKSHSCLHCGRIFNNKNNLKRHILIKHTSDKRFKCTICGRRYAIRQSLQYHINSIHGKDKLGMKLYNKTNQPREDLYSNGSQILPIHKSCIPSNTNSSYTVSCISNATTIMDNSCSILTTTSNPSTPSSYLTTLSLHSNMPASEEHTSHTERATAGDDNNLPTIQRIESICPIQRPPSTIKEILIMNGLATSDHNQDLSDSRNVKAEPHGTIPSSITGNSFNIFPNTARSCTLDNAKPDGLRCDLISCENLTSIESSSTTSSTNVSSYQSVVSTSVPKMKPAIKNVAARLHRCDHCARIFSTVHGYARHRRACNKHECPICHRGFSQIGNMRRHIKIFHSDQKPYECKVCNKAYGIQQSFRYHMRDKHGITAVSKPSGGIAVLTTLSQ